MGSGTVLGIGRQAGVFDELSGWFFVALTVLLVGSLAWFFVLNWRARKATIERLRAIDPQQERD